MNNFLKNLKEETNLTHTENGALTHKSTNDWCLDFFALAGAMRNRSNYDIINLFNKAYAEDPLVAMKLLFYMRDIRQGQGERRLFRVILNKMAFTNTSTVINNIDNIPTFGRWDDMLCLLETPCKKEILEYIKEQFIKDSTSDTPSLLAKWLPSENASSCLTKKQAKIIRKYLKITSKQYRKHISALRKKINVIECLISQNKWSEIEYDKLPSNAGFKYKQAFHRNDGERYSNFMLDRVKVNDAETPNKVNAKTLYPYEIIHKFSNDLFYYSLASRCSKTTETDIAMYDKYWNNLKDYFNGKEYNNLCVVDTSGSMRGTPIEVALSLGLYVSERAKGPFENHFITFSDEPELVKVKGANIYEKAININRSSWGFNTNIEATFDLLLEVALKNKCSQDEMPQNIIIISDMEFDDATSDYCTTKKYSNETLLEKIYLQWQMHKYEMPHIIFWNVDARQNNIPMLGRGRISYVSGFSPAIFESVLSNKSGYELMLETINKERYDCIKGK